MKTSIYVTLTEERLDAYSAEGFTKEDLGCEVEVQVNVDYCKKWAVDCYEPFNLSFSEVLPSGKEVDITAEVSDNDYCKVWGKLLEKVNAD